MTILRGSLTRLRQNSEMNIAAPSPKGTAIAIAVTVTLRVPRMSESTPERTLLCEVGYHSVVNRNFERLKSPKRRPTPSFATSTTFCPVSDMIQSMYFLAAGSGSPGVYMNIGRETG